MQLTGELKIRLADFKFPILCQPFNSVRPCTLLNSSLYANCARYTVSVQTSWAFIPRPSLDAILFRQGWRADKTMTSFHKNRIFVKTRKVMGNTDVAHYRGQLAKTLSSFSNEKLGVQKLAQDASQFTISVFWMIVNWLSSFSKTIFLKNVANFWTASLYDGQLEFVWKRLKIQSTFWDAFNRSFGLRPKLPADAIHFRQGWRADKAITSFWKGTPRRRSGSWISFG